MQKEFLPIHRFFEHSLVAQAKSFLTKKRFIFIVILLFVAIFISLFISLNRKKSPSPIEGKIQSKASTFSAGGRILDANKQPIEGAFVSIEGIPTITNKDGVWKISFSEKPSGNVVVLANGYEKLNKTYAKDNLFTLAELPKTPATVNILDEDNKALSNAFVLFLDENSYRPRQIQKTNREGKSEFANLPKDNGSFLVIMDGYKTNWGTFDLKNKENFTINLKKHDQTSLVPQLATSSAQMESRKKNVDIYYDPSLSDKNKFKSSVIFKIDSDQLYKELSSTTSFNTETFLKNVEIFSSDSKQPLIPIAKINIQDRNITGSQIVILGNSLDNDKVVSSIPLSIVLTKEYLLSITDKNDVISTILKLYSSEQANNQTTVVFKTENIKTEENVEPTHDASYLSYAVLSAKPEQKSDWYTYESSDCLRDFDIPLYKPHRRVILDGRYYGERDIYCEYHIERDTSEVIGEGNAKAITNSIIGWYKKAMEKDNWKVVSDENILKTVIFPRSTYIPAEFRKCKNKGATIWDGTDLFVYEGIIPESYGVFKDQFVFKLLMAQRRLFSPSQPELEYYGCPLETYVPSKEPVKPVSDKNIPKTGCFDTDGRGSREGWNTKVKGTVYVDGKVYVYTKKDGTKELAIDHCEEEKSGKIGYVEYYCTDRETSYKGVVGSSGISSCMVSAFGTACKDGACVEIPQPPEPKVTIGNSGCFGRLGNGACIGCVESVNAGEPCESGKNPSCPKDAADPYSKNYCAWYKIKYPHFNQRTFEWEFGTDKQENDYTIRPKDWIYEYNDWQRAQDNKNEPKKR